jgi:hypothetical protein
MMLFNDQKTSKSVSIFLPLVGKHWPGIEQLMEWFQNNVEG